MVLPWRSFLVTTKEDEERIFPRISRKRFSRRHPGESAQIGDQLIDRLAVSNIPHVVAAAVSPDKINFIDVDNVAAATPPPTTGEVGVWARRALCGQTAARSPATAKMAS
jgi:hypothetical protein